MKNDVDDVIAQIKAELNSIGRLNPEAHPGPGVTLFSGGGLPAGWIGIKDEEGRQAFGPASEILALVQKYVRQALADGQPVFSRPAAFWRLMQDLPTEEK